jgi:ribosomal protein S18 acetylase RimI-like enzyme
MNIQYKKIESCDYSFVSKLVDDNLKDVITKSFNGYFNYALFFDRAMQIGSAYLIFYDDDPCGFIWYSLKGMRLHVNTIVIDKEYQNKKIGTTVLNELETKARESNIPFMQLGVQGVNKKARDLYIRLGFKDIGYMKEFDTFYMEKRIL